MTSSIPRSQILAAGLLLITGLLVTAAVTPARAATHAFRVAIYVGGDTTEPCVSLARGQVGDCRVMVHLSTPGSTVSVTVWDSAGKTTMLDSFDVPTDEGGFGWIGGGGLEPGTYIEVADGTTTGMATVPALSASIDLATNSVSGTAATGWINTSVVPRDGTAVCYRAAAIDGSGAWSVDYATPKTDPADPGCAPSHSFGAGDWVQVAENDSIEFGSFMTVVKVHDFADDDDSVFESDITWMAADGITKGCNPPDNTLFCPDGVVTRGQMAAFLTRALGLTERLDDPFTDDDGSVFEGDIEKLAAAGITKGCNPPVNDRFCPDGKVTRQVMAAFLVRALGYTDDGGGDLFVDDDDSIFEADIDRLGTAGVTKGCNPPANDRYCPTGNVTRGQMAAFLHRALG